MDIEVVNFRDCSTLEELLDALDVLKEDAQEHSSAVFLRIFGYDREARAVNEFNAVRVELQEKTLTDGSKVKDILISAQREAN